MKELLSPFDKLRVRGLANSFMLELVEA